MSCYLECEAPGYPYPSVAWIYHQHVLQNKTDGIKVDTNLALHNPTKSYSGNYTCFAENELGNASYTVDVIVIGELVAD